MEGESSEGEIPFAKRSRTVHRYQSEPVLSDSTHEERYGQQFWERLSRRQSSCSMGTEGPGLMSSYPVARQDVAWGSLPAPGQEKLPSPAELCGGKKKRQRMNERRDMVMYYHLQDLRKKQSSIDQLKSLKWGGCETSESEIRAEITGAADASAQIPEVFRSPVRMAASERGVKPGDFLSSSPQQRRAGVRDRATAAQGRAHVLLSEPPGDIAGLFPLQPPGNPPRNPRRNPRRNQPPGNPPRNPPRNLVAISVSERGIAVSIPPSAGVIATRE
ncbi:uncharacterized protein LOC142475345 [Ascaphus truei]|uniref:uncharacterized protein LOC142475345 n=1 Tax=Ascaphus truei TaxID=8439 RepID=UPI003F5A4FD3